MYVFVCVSRSNSFSLVLVAGSFSDQPCWRHLDLGKMRQKLACLWHAAMTIIHSMNAVLMHDMFVCRSIYTSAPLSSVHFGLCWACLRTQDLWLYMRGCVVWDLVRKPCRYIASYWDPITVKLETLRPTLQCLLCTPLHSKSRISSAAPECLWRCLRVWGQGVWGNLQSITCFLMDAALHGGTCCVGERL